MYRSIVEIKPTKISLKSRLVHVALFAAAHAELWDLCARLNLIQFTIGQWSSIQSNFLLRTHTIMCSFMCAYNNCVLKWKSYDAIEIRFLAWAINWIHNMNIQKISNESSTKWGEKSTQTVYVHIRCILEKDRSASQTHGECYSIQSVVSDVEKWITMMAKTALGRSELQFIFKSTFFIPYTDNTRLKMSWLCCCCCRCCYIYISQ